MGKSDQIKKKMNKRQPKKISKEIYFQPYIDSVKERKLPWNIFEKILRNSCISGRSAIRAAQ